MKEAKVPWLIIEHHGVKCLHCGFTETLPLPMTFKVFIAYANLQMAQHRDCKPEGATP